MPSVFRQDNSRVHHPRFTSGESPRFQRLPHRRGVTPGSSLRVALIPMEVDVRTAPGVFHCLTRAPYCSLRERLPNDLKSTGRPREEITGRANYGA